MLCVLTVISSHGALVGYYGGGDTGDGYILTFHKYVQTISNSGVSTLLLYAFPMFIIVSVALILSRDYGDDFYEIEKANGIKVHTYLIGRLFALITINFLLLILFHSLIVTLNVMTRGGVQSWSLFQFISDASIRVLRFDFFVALPIIVFYVGLTYAIGTLFKSSLVSTILSLSYTIFFYVTFLFLRTTMAETYFNYLSPLPYILRRYIHFYDTEWFEEYIMRYGITPLKVFLCVLFLVSVATACSLISYIKLKKRNI